MIRDEFWMATDPIQRELGIEFRRENSFQSNSSLSPMPGRCWRHSVGDRRDFGMPRSPEQEEFMDQAVAGLAVENTVMSVRLALFAQMFRGREWSPRNPERNRWHGQGWFHLPGRDPVSRYADPRHKRHLSAIQSVLKVLLPESGTDIKGNMKSHRALLEASGYCARPKEFDAFLRILDSELRLITPTEPVGKNS